MEIDRIRKLAREQGVDLAVHGLVCLPQELKKYTGSIWRREKKGGGVAYDVHLQYKDFKLSKSFNTRAKADQYLGETNVRENLPIKNKFTIYKDQVLVELPGDKLLICDYDDLYLIKMHNWCCSRVLPLLTLAAVLLCNASTML